jgi:hypothetical protein
MKAPPKLRNLERSAGGDCRATAGVFAIRSQICTWGFQTIGFEAKSHQDLPVMNELCQNRRAANRLFSKLSDISGDTRRISTCGIKQTPTFTSSRQFPCGLSKHFQHIDRFDCGGVIRHAHGQG